MNIKIPFILISIFLNSLFSLTDLSENITSALRSGDSKTLAVYFWDNIDLKINTKEGIFSKQQAEAIVQDFFSKQTIKNYSVTHTSETKKETQYIIGILVTSVGKFRVYFLIKKFNNISKIQQFRIEPENE